MIQNDIYTFILEKLAKGYNIEYIKNSKEFNNIVENNITISKAQSIETLLRYNGKLPKLTPYDIIGTFWLKTFDYPSNGDSIYINNKYIGKARNIGILTFHIVKEEQEENEINRIINKNLL